MTDIWQARTATRLLFFGPQEQTMKQRSQARVRHTVTQALRQWQGTLAAIPDMIRDDRDGLTIGEIEDMISEVEQSHIQLRRRSTREHS
jgi:hypothetical protein